MITLISQEEAERQRQAEIARIAALPIDFTVSFRNDQYHVRRKGLMTILAKCDIWDDVEAYCERRANGHDYTITKGKGCK